MTTSGKQIQSKQVNIPKGLFYSIILLLYITTIVLWLLLLLFVLSIVITTFISNVTKV